MRNAAEEFAALKKMHATAELHAESGKPLVFLPAFKFRAAGAAQEMNLLLYPWAHSGYVTRLFFEKALVGAGKSGNWRGYNVLGGKWWAPSWKDVIEDQPWTSMLGSHLLAVA
jgi:hypothetical protein